MFLQVSVILSTGGGVSASVHAGIPCPLGADTHPSGSRHPPPEQTTPNPGAETPLVQSMLGDTVNARAVRILLECNLVFFLIDFEELSLLYEKECVYQHALCTIIFT